MLHAEEIQNPCDRHGIPKHWPVPKKATRAGYHAWGSLGDCHSRRGYISIVLASLNMAVADT